MTSPCFHFTFSSLLRLCFPLSLSSSLSLSLSGPFLLVFDDFILCDLFRSNFFSAPVRFSVRLDPLLRPFTFQPHYR